MFKRRVLTSLFIIFLSGVIVEASENGSIRKNRVLLQRLDSIIANHDQIINRKEQRIADLRSSLKGNLSCAERLAVSRRLYEEYLVYDSDSALYYAGETARLAELVEPDNPDLALDCRINQAFVYAALGFFNDATMTMQSVSAAGLSDALKPHYYRVADFIYSLQVLYMRDNDEKRLATLAKTDAYRDSLQAFIPGGYSDALWVPIARMVEGGNYKPSQAEVDQLKEVADAAMEASRQNAINNYWLSRYYELIGDTDNHIHYLTRAAIYDAEIENREIAATQELAVWLFQRGDLTRAYNYLMYCSEQANRYKNRSRMVTLSGVLPTVHDAYRKSLENHLHATRCFLVVLGLLSLCLLALGAYIIFEYRKLKRTREDLSRVNDELKTALESRDSAITALAAANTGLNEANAVTKGTIGFAFRLTTDYINALEAYRKKLLKFFKNKLFDDLGQIINDTDLVKELYQGFYVDFDRTVLSIFPDFVQEYNSTAPEDARVSPKTIAKSLTLNTRLRIHALRRMGIDKSADIARMLNISIRTVYNNRNPLPGDVAED